MRIRTAQAAEIAAQSDAVAGDEKAERGIHGLALRDHRQTDHQCRKPTPIFSRHEMECPHLLPPG